MLNCVLFGEDRLAQAHLWLSYKEGDPTNRILWLNPKLRPSLADR